MDRHFVDSCHNVVSETVTNCIITRIAVRLCRPTQQIVTGGRSKGAVWGALPLGLSDVLVKAERRL